MAAKALWLGEPASREPCTKKAKQAVISSRSNLYFCNCLAEWPRPAGSQGNPNHDKVCARQQRTVGTIAVEPTIGQVLGMLPGSKAALAGRTAVRFVGPKADDWVPI